MTEAAVIQVTRKHLESLFPKVCSNCGRVFATLREYVRDTQRVGTPIAYDAELGNWNPLRPIGTLSCANCRCGTTLSLSSHGLPLIQYWRLLNWARIESKRRRMSVEELLNYTREAICEQVLAEPVPDPDSTG